MFRQLYRFSCLRVSLFRASRIVKEVDEVCRDPQFRIPEGLARSASASHVILGLPMHSDLDLMQMALQEAQVAALAGEVPVGALIVQDGVVLARSGNRTIRDCDPTAHAEIVVIRKAARLADNYRLANSTLYVTIEPCSMCAGAIIQARIARLVYGADDPKGGAVRSCFEVLTSPLLNHRVQITPGVLAVESAGILQSFFASRR
jgi:tRNA(adenine34) deaminase